jgi:outer membrane receptor protein involved in Fe transport
MRRTSWDWSAAFLGASRPDWKWNVNLGYAWGGAQVSTQWRYIAGMSDYTERDYEVPSVDYLDAFASYEFAGALSGLTIRAGIENITDQDPPLLPSAVAANTDPSQYDLLGRRYSVSASYRF